MKIGGSVVGRPTRDSLAESFGRLAGWIVVRPAPVGRSSGDYGRLFGFPTASRPTNTEFIGIFTPSLSLCSSSLHVLENTAWLNTHVLEGYSRVPANAALD